MPTDSLRRPLHELLHERLTPISNSANGVVLDRGENAYSTHRCAIGCASCSDRIVTQISTPQYNALELSARYLAQGERLSINSIVMDEVRAVLRNVVSNTDYYFSDRYPNSVVCSDCYDDDEEEREEDDNDEEEENDDDDSSSTYSSSTWGTLSSSSRPRQVNLPSAYNGCVLGFHHPYKDVIQASPPPEEVVNPSVSDGSSSPSSQSRLPDGWVLQDGGNRGVEIVISPPIYNDDSDAVATAYGRFQPDPLINPEGHVIFMSSGVNTVTYDAEIRDGTFNPSAEAPTPMPPADLSEELESPTIISILDDDGRRIIDSISYRYAMGHIVPRTRRNTSSIDAAIDDEE